MRSLSRSGAALLLSLLAGRAAAGPWSGQVDLASTLLSRPKGSLQLARAQALGVAISRQSGDLRLFLRAEANGWRDPRDDGSHDFTLTANIGLGLDFSYAGGRLRSGLAAGTSLLLVPDDVDQAPQAGLFVDLRPLAILWPLAPDLHIGLVPLSLVVALPVLTGIPLVCLQYRTTVLLERPF